MKSKPYIPQKNGLALAWMLNFSAVITAAPAAVGLTAGDATAISTAVAAFDASMTVLDAPETRTPVAVQANRTARAQAEAICRLFAQQIQQREATTNAQRADLGLTIPNIPAPIAAPTSFPLLDFLSATPGVHKLQSRDSETPTSKAKPPGVVGLELVASVGVVAATDPAQCETVGTFTRSPLRVHYGAGANGKIATYFGRWVTRSGPGGVAQKGPWSSAIQAVVVGA